MMGTKPRLFTPVTALSLDELVPADHFYRHLDRVLDLSFVRDLGHDCYVADKGRPSVDPVVFLRLQLVMFFARIRSERQLVRLAADRLSVRWYLGYNLGEGLPDHSTLTRIRIRDGLAVFRRFFEAIVEQCQQAGLVWGRALYFDATQVRADAALDSLTARFAVEARQARQAQEAQQAEPGRADGRADGRDAGERDSRNVVQVPRQVESAEAVPHLVPEILDRLGPATLSPEHQRTVRALAKRLHEAGGYPYATIYADLGAAFHVGKDDQIPAAAWPAVTEWFRARIQTAERRQRGG